MAQEAIDAYRDFHDALNEFAQDGFPAERQGELRLHVTGDYADLLLRNWQNGREYSFHQEGQAEIASTDVLHQTPEEESISLAVCEDLSDYEIVDSSGEPVGQGAGDSALAEVSMRLVQDRYQGQDLWVISKSKAQEGESCLGQP